jgi:hypothetical protein
MKTFYIETQTKCDLVEAQTAKSAERKAQREIGNQEDIVLVRVATPEDIVWVRNMQGDQG